MKLYNEELSRLESSLEQLELETDNVFITSDKRINLCRNSLYRMRENVMNKGFKNIQAECHFFKNIKPKVVGHIIHSVNLIYIEKHRPFSSGKEQHKFYVDYISTLKNYFLEHSEAYDYYIRNLSHLDVEYFTRNELPQQLYCDSLTSLIDIKFGTAKDMIFAQFIGNTQTINYLKKQISRKNGKYISSGKRSASLKWTGAKVDLVELVYALHSSGSINNGRADIKEIFSAFEEIIESQLGDYYRTFLEIRNRKNQPTKFLDFLKSSLRNKMIEADAL